MAAAPSFLKLSILTEWDAYTLELKPGESFTLGRSPDCKVPVPRSSVSLEHLKVTWTGYELKFDDLKSSNGTFRMPKESPFVSAAFSQCLEPLELKLSKSLVVFKWEVVKKGDVTQAQPPTSTEIAAEKTLQEVARLKMTQPRESNRESLIPLNIDIEKTRISKEQASPKFPTEDSAHFQLSNETQLNLELKDLTKSHIARGANLHTKSSSTKGGETQIREAPTQIDTRIVARQNAATPSLAAWSRFAAFITFTIAASYFAFTWIWGHKILAGIGSASHRTLKNGGAHDAYLIFLSVLKYYAVPLASSFVSVILFSVFVRKRLTQKKSKNFATFAAKFETQKTPFFTTQFFDGMATFLLFASISWPFLWCQLHGANLAKTERYLKFLQYSSQFEPTEPEKNIVQLKEFLPEFEGSSFLYKHFLIQQRKRILDTCEGVGESAPWNLKRNCLVLLQVASIEILQDTRPALINEVAQRVCILLSLDGIIRTIVVDGKDSTTVNFFLATLEAVGLRAEKEDIESVIARRDFSEAEVTAFLRDLRRRIELRLDVVQLENNFPDALYIRVPGPLESGI